MIYVFDSSSLIDLFRHFYPNRFPTLWTKYNEMIDKGRIVSTREVYHEIEGGDDRLSIWAKNNRSFFTQPSESELLFVAEIFKITHFQTLVKKKEQLSGKPVADPFVISKAKITDGTVVTEENKKDHSAKIPNVCEHFGIQCLNLEKFMDKENWTF